MVKRFMPAKSWLLLVAFVGAFLLTPHMVLASSSDCTVGGKPGVQTSIAFGGQTCIPIGDGDVNSNIIIVVLKIVLAFLGGGIGIAIVMGIVYGGFLYMTARADAGQVKKGEEVIRNAVIALLAFLGMAAILNFLVPGGVLG